MFIQICCAPWFAAPKYSGTYEIDGLGFPYNVSINYGG
jgi:hypothetical protein